MAKRAASSAHNQFRLGAHDDPEPGGLAFSLTNCGPVPGSLYDSGLVQALTAGAITVRGD